MSMPPPAAPAPKSQSTETQKTQATAKSTPKLSDFEIEKRIGKGQFSVVYKVKQKQVKRKSMVALKKVQVVQVMFGQNVFLCISC